MCRWWTDYSLYQQNLSILLLHIKTLPIPIPLYNWFKANSRNHYAARIRPQSVPAPHSISVDLRHRLPYRWTFTQVRNADYTRDSHTHLPYNLISCSNTRISHFHRLFPTNKYIPHRSSLQDTIPALTRPNNMRFLSFPKIRRKISPIRTTPSQRKS